VVLQVEKKKKIVCIGGSVKEGTGGAGAQGRQKKRCHKREKLPGEHRGDTAYQIVMSERRKKKKCRT